MVINEKTAALFVVVLLAVFGIKHMIHASIYQGEELTACKAFVTAHDAVAREFGSIREIEPGGGGSRKFGRNPSGSIVFHVAGTQKRGYLSVSWIHQGDDIVVTRIAMPLAFWKEAMLWPENRASDSRSLVPFHIWYKLGYLLDAFIAAVIVACILLRRRVSSRVAAVMRSETTCGLILLAGVCSLLCPAATSGLWLLSV